MHDVIARPAIPLPPEPLRRLVGRADAAMFEADDDLAPLDGLPATIYRSVLDFGCGVGRTARVLLRRGLPVERYLGIDINRELIGWCRDNLAPLNPAYTFVHHDARDSYFNREGSADVLPLPAESGTVSLVVAVSVFTHLTESQALQYLHEVGRVLERGGVCYATWFTFARTSFAFLNDQQFALYASYEAPHAAVAFDRGWIERTATGAGLTISRFLPADETTPHARYLLVRR